MQQGSPRKKSIESTSTTNKSNKQDWNEVEERIQEFLDSCHVHQGNPLIKKEQFFSKSQLKVFNLRKNSLEDKISLDLPHFIIKKKNSCVDFEKEGNQFKLQLKSWTSSKEFQ